MRQIRTDIQALRGYAVLLVVLQHGKAEWLSAGFLGVDVFFVISGFLITGLVKASIERGDFSIGEFYFRRAKRLLPAAYVTFFVTTILARFMLPSSEASDFGLQLIGAVTYTANIVLWQQTGYFAEPADLKPLLHVWSLAVEEQFYLLLPWLLVFIAPQRWLRVAVVVLIASLALCVLGGQIKPVATFYLLPTRAWELALGSVGAFLTADPRALSISKRLVYPALGCLVIVPIFPVGGTHPGIDAVLVCASTLIVLLAKQPLLNETRAVSWLARVGDFSYSLYLVHWPVLVFTRSAWVGSPPGELPIGARILAIVLSFILGYLLYRGIELPIRGLNIQRSRRVWLKIALASIALAAFGSGLVRASPEGNAYPHMRRPNYGLGVECSYESAFVETAPCRTSATPQMLVWGDSFAMHIVPGIVATAHDVGIVQATRSMCGPFVNVAPIQKHYIPSQKHHDRAWAEKCIDFNESVLRYLAATKSIEVVVLASPFRAYVNANEFRILRRGRGESIVVDASISEATRGLQDTIDAIRALGRRVVVVAPPPSQGFDIGACLERRADDKVALGAPADCAVTMAGYKEYYGGVIDLLHRLSVVANVEVIDFDGLLCDASACQTRTGKTFIYRDIAHFSYDGSIWMGRKLDLAQRLNAVAR